jgi:predicted transcriptional regulator
MLLHMKAILIELEPDVAARLEAVAPGQSRRRSDFIRAAIRKALWELEEQATEAAYRAQPEGAEPVYFDAGAWEARPPRRSRGKRPPR